MRPFSFVDAASVAEAASLLLSRPGAALIAGGSDLLGLLKEGIPPVPGQHRRNHHFPFFSGRGTVDRHN